MATRIETFSPDLIHNFDRLKTLFSGEKELAEIDELPEEALVRPKNFSYFNRWQIAWIIITSPFTCITFVFLKTVATFFSCLFIRSLANRIHLMATHVARNIDYLYIQLNHGSSLWVPSFNDYQLGLSDVYNQWSVKREEILEPRIKAKLHKKLNCINYSRIGKGLCWGGVHWFNYLLLKQMGRIGSNPEALKKSIIGVAKQFESGQPRQAALMQSVYGLENDLLDITENVITIAPENLKDTAFMLNTIKNLSNGVYALKMDNHVASYVKWDGDECIWDPNGGLIHVERTEDLLDLIYKHTQGKVDPYVFFALQNLKRSLFYRLWNLLPKIRG